MPEIVRQLRGSRRWTLFLLIAVAQLVTLLATRAWFDHWLGERLIVTAREAALNRTTQLAAQLATTIDTLVDADVDRDTILAVVETTGGASQDARVLLIDDQTGAIVADTGGADPAQHVDMLLSAAASSANVSGIHLVNGEPFAYAGYPLTRYGAWLLVDQSADDLRQVVAELRENVRWISMVVVLVMTAVGLLATALIVEAYERHLSRINAQLEQLVERRSRALMRTRDAVIFGLATLAESRDSETGAHLARLRRYTEVLARAFYRRRRGPIPDHVETLGIAAVLHDVGKVGVPDAVLKKPGPLTDDERREMQRHPIIGGDTLMSIKRRLGEDDFLTSATEIIFAHHERWDGGGYPFGLRGEEIPLSARIVMLADVYDALRSPRVYKSAMPHAEARALIIADAGTHFDPEVVEAFLACETEFDRIAADGEAPDL